MDDVITVIDVIHRKWGTMVVATKDDELLFGFDIKR